jgi:methylenetetrahydrofolate--tRNA-(uracil-5-)-methyltransferase
MHKVTIIGAGLAGSEAAWQIAEAGMNVDLYEMRPETKTPAHHTGLFAELVCSNSLRAAGVENAAGLLKEEMRFMNSLIMKAADAARVPAGGALAVDRLSFSEYITDALTNHPLVNVIKKEIEELPENRPLIIATGPLTSLAFSNALSRLTGRDSLYFYDAAAPILTSDSLDYEKIYRLSRYGKTGGLECPNEVIGVHSDGDYLNCPMNKKEYENFYRELSAAETAPVKDFEKIVLFEGCMPIEAIAKRGIDTMRFGPLKPVGLDDPRTGARPYAVVQLRQDNTAATLYNMVGFQTQLKWEEQRRVFSLIPGLEKADFVRFGVMHRNTFINSPELLNPTMQMTEHEGIFFAGQITGVEGYVESAANGIVAGINAGRFLRRQNLLTFPETTALGALCRYVTTPGQKNFQPMNINFALLPPLDEKIRDKKIKNRIIAQKALTELRVFSNITNLFKFNE